MRDRESVGERRGISTVMVVSVAIVVATTMTKISKDSFTTTPKNKTAVLPHQVRILLMLKKNQWSEHCEKTQESQIKQISVCLYVALRR